MKDIRGIVYDCDGVLFQSQKANLAYYNAILEHFGEPEVRSRDKEKALLCHTAASPQVLATLMGSERVKEALTFAGNLDYRRFIPYMSPEPGLTQALELLSAHFPLAIATNRGNSMSEILAHFGIEGYFRAVVTSRDVVRPKPYPDMLLLAAEKLGVATENLLFVGDSELDRRAARAAGILFAAYGRGVRGEFAIYSHQELTEFFF